MTRARCLAENPSAPIRRSRCETFVTPRAREENRHGAARAATRGGMSLACDSLRGSGSERGSRARSAFMNAIDLLRSDHEAVSDLFEEFEDAEESEQGIIAEQVCALLTVHARIEEEIFYPAVRQAFGNEGEELADEALVEHDGIGKLVEEIAAADAGDAMFRAKVKVL